MEYISEGMINAIKMIVSFDQEMIRITLVSLKVSTLAIFIATLFGVPVGFYIGIREFKGKRVVVTILNTLMAIPAVAVGLIVYSIISRRGPLGMLGLLYTPWAMVIGQAILAFPIVSALSLTATQSIDKKIEKTAISLGANNLQSAIIIFHESRFAIIAAIIAGFGRIFSEVGISMMVGGNIRGYTRNITTAIALETVKGEFAMGIALGLILLIVAFSINILVHYLQLKTEWKHLF